MAGPEEARQGGESILVCVLPNRALGRASDLSS